MAKQTKILDINTKSAHLICIMNNDPKENNPYRIYLVTSARGTPVRKRFLQKYGDFISVLCFIKEFYLEGTDTLCYTEMVEWIKSRTVA